MHALLRSFDNLASMPICQSETVKDECSKMSAPSRFNSSYVSGESRTTYALFCQTDKCYALNFLSSSRSAIDKRNNDAYM